MPTIIGTQVGGVSGTTTLANGVITDEFEITFLVLADTVDQREPTILATPGIPAIAEFWSGGTDSSTTSRCTSRTATDRDDGSLIWEVSCRFTTDTSEDDEEAAEDPENPQDWTPKVAWSFRTLQEVMEEDADGDAVVNSQDEPLLPMHDVNIPVLTVKRYKINFLPSEITDYVNRVNSDQFYGVGEKQALIVGIRADQTKIQNVKLWEVTYTIEFRLDKTWELRLLDHGSKYTNDDGETVPFRVKGQPTTGNLDGFGGEAPEGITAFKTFQRFPTVAFAPLDLGPF